MNCRFQDRCYEKYDGCEKECPLYPRQTNADRIRAMSDEELAEFLILSPEMEFEICRYCTYGNPTSDDRGQCLRDGGRCYANDRCKAFKIYLKQEAPQ